MAGYRARQVAVGLAAAAAITVAAQDEQPAPTFRSEINYVQLPVRVLDADGRFVPGLTASDFRVAEDGRVQTIAAFTAVDLPFVPVDSTVPSAPLPGLDATASNETPEVDGRVYLFVLDDYSAETGDTLKVRNLMHGFIDERLSANDLAAISIVGGARSQGFTRNRRLLHDAVDRFIGDRVETWDGGNPFGDAGGMSGAISGLQRQQTLNTITRMVEWLGSIEGRRKSLVWISSGPICSLAEAECRESMQHALRITMQSDVSVYVVDPTGLDRIERRSRAASGNPDSRLSTDGGYTEASSETAARAAFADMRSGARGPLDGARYLAEESGGMAVVNTNDLQRGLDRIVRDASSYYLLGYHSTNNRTDGRFRRNEVTVGRKDVRVVHRNGYFAARQDRPPDAAPAPASTIAARLRELARSPVPVSAMPLRVAATPFLSGENKARVAVVVEMPPRGLKPATDDGRYRLNVGLHVGFYDRSGKPVAGDDPTMDLDIPLSAAPKVTPNGVRMVSRVEVPPGAYRLWVGATQTPSGTGGSVMTEIDIPDFNTQPLALSGIAVSSTDARRIFTARTDALLDDVFGGPPVAHRDFNAGSDVWLYGEIYDRRSNGGDVTADVVVTSASGEVVYRTAFEAAPVQFGHLARIPLGEIGAGSFVATIEARSSSPQPISATRSVAFRVR